MNTAKFKMGQRVYSVLNAEARGIVTGLLYRPTTVLYLVTWSDMREMEHSDIELSEEPVRDFAD